MNRALSFWGCLLLLQALFATTYARQRYLLAPESQILQSEVTPLALEPAVEPPALEASSVESEEQSASQQVTGALETASGTVSDVGGAVVEGTTEVVFAVVDTASQLSTTIQNLVAAIDAGVGRKLQADDIQN